MRRGCAGREAGCGLDRDLIRQVIQDHRSQVRFCYESELQRTPTLSGRVALKFVIDHGGRVSSAQVVDSDLKNSAVERCLAGRVRTWVFPRPKTGSQVVVTYPFMFKRAAE